MVDRCMRTDTHCDPSRFSLISSCNFPRQFIIYLQLILLHRSAVVCVNCDLSGWSIRIYSETMCETLNDIFSRGDRTLLINQLDSKGLMTDSISEKGLFLRNPFLTCTRWCEVPFLHDFPHSVWENIKKNIAIAILIRIVGKYELFWVMYHFKTWKIVRNVHINYNNLIHKG